VHLDDTLWKVFGPDLPLNTRVRIVAVDGISLRVEPLKGSADTAPVRDNDSSEDGGGGGD